MVSIFDSANFNENMFFPRKEYYKAPENAKDIHIKVENGVLLHHRIYYSSKKANVSILYFHGNGEVVCDYDDLAQNFTDLGVELIVSEYRGYGASTGKPTLRAALEDAHKVYHYLKNEGQLLPKVVVLGRSLGSSAAIEICANIAEIDACILDSGSASLINLAARRGIQIDSIKPEEQIFDNGAKMRKVTCPLLVLHGALDHLIFPQEAQINYQNAASTHKQLVILEDVGHNDIMYSKNNAYFSALDSFLLSLHNNGSLE